MKRIISLLICGAVLVACSGIHSANVATNHGAATYSKESGINANANTSSTNLNYQRNSSVAQ